MPKDDLPILILVTAGGRDDAERLGEGLVVEHLAGRCSVVSNVHSFYYSEAILQREHEALLLIYTMASRRAAVMEHLQQHHDYERSEIIEVNVTGGSVPSLEWLAQQVANPGPDR